MQVTTEQTTAKLKILPKPVDEMTDEELLAFVENNLRPERGKPRTKKAAAGHKPRGSRELDDDDLA